MRQQLLISALVLAQIIHVFSTEGEQTKPEKKSEKDYALEDTSLLEYSPLTNKNNDAVVRWDEIQRLKEEGTQDEVFKLLLSGQYRLTNTADIYLAAREYFLYDQSGKLINDALLLLEGIQNDRHSPESLNLLAGVSEYFSNYQPARFLYEKAFILSGYSAYFALYNKYLLEHKTGLFTEANQTMMMMEKYFPGHRRNYLSRAVTFYNLSNYERAAGYLNICSLYDASDTDRALYFYIFSLFQEGLGLYEKAKDYINIAVSRDPGNEQYRKRAMYLSAYLRAQNKTSPFLLTLESISSEVQLLFNKGAVQGFIDKQIENKLSFIHRLIIGHKYHEAWKELQILRAANSGLFLRDILYLEALIYRDNGAVIEACALIKQAAALHGRGSFFNTTDILLLHDLLTSESRAEVHRKKEEERMLFTTPVYEQLQTVLFDYIPTEQRYPAPFALKTNFALARAYFPLTNEKNKFSSGIAKGQIPDWLDSDEHTHKMYEIKSAGGKLLHVTQRNYKNNTAIEELLFDNRGQLLLTRKFEKNEAGQLISEIDYLNETNEIIRKNYNYDRTGKINTIQTLSGEKVIEEVKYDETGLTSVAYIPGGSLSKATRLRTDGNTMYRELYLMDALFSVETVELNEGRARESKIFDHNGTLTEYSRYEYSGDLLKRLIRFTADGREIETITYIPGKEVFR